MKVTVKTPTRLKTIDAVVNEKFPIISFIVTL